MIKQDTTNIERIIAKIDNDFNFVNKVYDFYKLISYKTR